MSQPVINYSKVVKKYGRQVVLSEVNLDIQEGEYLGLVGANGAGKTTMIKCLLDFTRCDSGSIKIHNVDNIDHNSRSCLAYLPEKFLSPYYLTGEEFLDYTSRLYGVVYDQAHLNEIAAVLDLDMTILKKAVRKYSKGMSQKLGLAACLLSNKDLLIMDEPMGGLDPRARAYLKQYLLDLKEKGKTLFFSTHLLSDVETICDKVAILHEGSIRFTGSPAECCEHFGVGDFEQAYLRSTLNFGP